MDFIYRQAQFLSLFPAGIKITETKNSVMAFYNRSDMIYPDYLWTHYPKDDPRISGLPGNTILNRRQGREVLYLINKMAELYNLKKKSNGRRIEILIREYLPESIRQQEEAESWIKENWNCGAMEAIS